MEQLDEPVTSSLTGAIFIILLLAALFTWLLSVLLLRRYHAAVLKSMSAAAIHPLRAETAEETLSNAKKAQPTSKPPPAGAATDSPEIHTELIYKKALVSPWQAAGIYAVAGAGYAVVMTIAFLSSGAIEFNVFRFFVMFLVYAWPVVLTLNLVAVTSKRTGFATVVGYFLLYTLVGIFVAGRNAESSLFQFFVLWLIMNLPATVLFFAFLNRKVRAVGPLIFTLISLGITGSFVVLSIMGSSDANIMHAVHTGSFLGLGVTGTLLSLVAIGLILFGLIGWGALNIIRQKYERKELSDLSVNVDALWLFFSLVQSVSLGTSGSAWMLSGLCSFVIYKLVVKAGLIWWRKRSGVKSNSSLLLLRVFSLGERSEQLYDKFTKYWRYVGSIQLIAGPDLATTTIEPHEFLDFISGKLSRRFIDSAQTLELRLREMDVAPDQDKRYRINDFFCYDDTWKMVLSGLLEQSQVVLMDLRGFSDRNNGCIFEIKELLNNKPVEQLIIIVDSTTATAYLNQTLQELWRELSPGSPNRFTTVARLTLFQLTSLGDNEMKRLLWTVCKAATTSSFKTA